MASDFQDLKTKVFATVATDAENHIKGCNLTNLVRNFLYVFSKCVNFFHSLRGLNYNFYVHF